jgi:hypothetical protein
LEKRHTQQEAKTVAVALGEERREDGVNVGRRLKDVGVEERHTDPVQSICDSWGFEIPGKDVVG